MHHRAVWQCATKVSAGIAHELFTHSASVRVKSIGISREKTREYLAHQRLTSRTIAVATAIEPWQRGQER